MSDAVLLARISSEDHQRLMREAGLRVRSLAGRQLASDALINAIRSEVDAAAREAQWSAWIDSFAAADELQPRDLEALAALRKSTPIVGIPHHEFPSRTVPAFAVAARAAVLLARHARLSRSRELADRNDELANSLKAPLGSPAFVAGLDALGFVSAESLAGIVEKFRKHERNGLAAARILLKAAEVDSNYWALLPEIVRRGDAATGRRALRLALDLGAPQLPDIAGVALARAELGGLALVAARRSGMHPDEFCWTLLGDPVLGADAARMLAAESNRLFEEISARIEEAPALARLRMLLALRLHGTDASHAMLAELVEATWLSEQQRREVRSWL